MSRGCKLMSQKVYESSAGKMKLRLFVVVQQCSGSSSNGRAREGEMDLAEARSEREKPRNKLVVHDAALGRTGPGKERASNSTTPKNSPREKGWERS